MTLAERYQKRLRTDKQLNAIREKIRVSTDYGDADEYAARASEILADELIYDVEKQGIENFNAAIDEVAWDALQEQYEVITEGASYIQNNMNVANGIGLETKVAEFDSDRAGKLLYEFALSEDKTGMAEAIISYGQAYVDETVKRNMDSHAKVGLKPTLIREAEPTSTVTKLHKVFSKKGKKYEYNRTYQVPCLWCARLAGTYDYAEVKSGEDVFRRHKGCRCKVTYVENGTATDVHEKVDWNYSDSEARAQAIRVKEQQAEAEARLKEINRKERSEAIATLIDRYRFSVTSASKFYNAHIDEIREFGVNYVVDKYKGW